MIDNFQTFMETNCVRNAAFPAIRWSDENGTSERTYEELWLDILRTAAWLKDHGLTGRRAVLIGPSSHAWMTLFLAVTCTGGTAVPLDPRLPAEELADLIGRTDPALIAVDARGVEAMRRAVSDKEVLELAEDKAPFAPGPDDGRLPSLPPEPDPDSTAAILFTSGSTGRRKGVCLSQRNLISNVMAHTVSFVPGMVMLSILPPHHAYALTSDWMMGFRAGSLHVICDSPAHLMRDIKEARPEIIMAVPALLEAIARRVESLAEMSSPTEIREKVLGGRLSFCYCGAATLPPGVIEIFQGLGVDVFTGYGMTECSPVIAMNCQTANKEGTVGKPLPGTEIRFENGEILVHGPGVMQGYLNMPEATAECLIDGWLHTGDLGYLDEDGYLCITGRIKDVILLSGGETISPREIETLLCRDPLIYEVSVTAAPNGLQAEIFPNQTAAKAAGLTEETLGAAIEAAVSRFNREQPIYRRIVKTLIKNAPLDTGSSSKGLF